MGKVSDHHQRSRNHTLHQVDQCHAFKAVIHLQNASRSFGGDIAEDRKTIQQKQRRRIRVVGDGSAPQEANNTSTRKATMDVAVSTRPASLTAAAPLSICFRSRLSPRYLTTTSAMLNDSKRLTLDVKLTIMVNTPRPLTPSKLAVRMVRMVLITLLANK